MTIQTNDSAFTGTLADAESTFVTLAIRTVNTTNARLVYIPNRKINAVTTE